MLSARRRRLAVGEIRAADLPEGSVVVDDMRGIAFYAFTNPGDLPDRWTGDGEGCVLDSAVDFALRNGGKVLRHGYGQEG